MKKCLLFILGFILLSFTACEYKFIDPIEVELPDEPVSFTGQIIPIFQDKCVTCHSSTSPILTTSNAYGNLINGNYIDTVIPEQSALYEKVNDGHPGGNEALNATELALILKWITEGARNN